MSVTWSGTAKEKGDGEPRASPLYPDLSVLNQMENFRGPTGHVPLGE